jgi:hypothetical protein
MVALLDKKNDFRGNIRNDVCLKNIDQKTGQNERQRFPFFFVKKLLQ